jgi:hypothetical protein
LILKKYIFSLKHPSIISVFEKMALLSNSREDLGETCVKINLSFDYINYSRTSLSLRCAHFSSCDYNIHGSRFKRIDCPHRSVLYMLFGRLMCLQDIFTKRLTLRYTERRRRRNGRLQQFYSSFVR